jgi:hypothetical protein
MKNIHCVVFCLMAGCCQPESQNKLEKPPCEPGGIVIENEQLKVRFSDNSPRFVNMYDEFVVGMNGIAFMAHKDQGKNIFAHVGMNLEACHTYPPAGKVHEQPQNTRKAPIKMEKMDEQTVRFFQDADEGAGLNFDITYKVHGHYVDHTITTWPNHDLDSCSAFWASYMHQLQNTSLFMKKPDALGGEYVEVSSPGHGVWPVFTRPYDPNGLTWHEHLRDNPLLRQAIRKSDETMKATTEAGFEAYPQKKMDHWYYGFVDEYVYLMIFKEKDWIMWYSPSGSKAVRSPAWDYEFKSGAQNAGEKKTYHVRLVYKKFIDFKDVIWEVERFLE